MCIRDSREGIRRHGGAHEENSDQGEVAHRHKKKRGNTPTAAAPEAAAGDGTNHARSRLFRGYESPTAACGVGRGDRKNAAQLAWLVDSSSNSFDASADSALHRAQERRVRTWRIVGVHGVGHC